MSTVDIPLEGTPVEVEVIDANGEIDVEALRNNAPQFWTVGDSAALDQEYTAYINELQADYPPQVAAAFDAALSPVKLAIDDGTITPPQGEQFLRWLNYNKGVTSIANDATTTPTMTSYLSQWIIEQSNLTQKLGPIPITPAPAPITPVAPAPTLAPNPPAPAPLPTPTPGQQATVSASQGITGGTVAGTGGEGVSAAQVSAALAATAVEVLEVVARVFDAFLPGMAPGQVPEALRQLNQAAHVLEDQLAVLRATTTGHAVGSLSGQITALQAALALVQLNITNLQDQLAEKADSGLEDDLAGAKSQIAEVAGTVGTLSTVTVPALASGLQSLTSTVGALDSEITTKIAPQLTATAQATDANTETLSGTDKDCLDQLCDAEGNVINPITEGGATPSLLGKLGGLLGALFGVGAIMTAVEALETLLDAPAVVTAVVQDTETMTTWATQAAGVITGDFAWSGGLNVNIPASS